MALQGSVLIISRNLGLLYSKLILSLLDFDSLNAFFRNFSSNEIGRKYLNQNFKFCTPMNKTEDWNTFYDYLVDVLGNLAMANYPYVSCFTERNLTCNNVFNLLFSRLTS